MKATRRRGAALEDAILDAGWAQVLAGGYTGFTIEAIADRAGTGKAAIYRRWQDKESLLLAVLARYVSAPNEVPDTGSLRDDVLALLRSANRHGESAVAVLGALLGAYFDRNATAPGQLRERFLEARGLAMPTIVDRAIGRNELAAPLPERVLRLPFDLLLLELIMNLGHVADETLIDIIDNAFLPLATGASRSG